MTDNLCLVLLLNWLLRQQSQSRCHVSSLTLVTGDCVGVVYTEAKLTVSYRTTLPLSS